MIKSIYTRVVITFLGSIILGTVISFFVVNWMYEEELNNSLQVTLLDFGEDIVKLYETFPLDKVDTFVSEMKQLNSYYIRIYDDQLDQFQAYGELNGHQPLTVTKAQLMQVLNDEVYLGKTNGIDPILLGLPLHTGQGIKALFLERIAPPSSLFLIKWIYTFLIASLIAGSLLILGASMFLVRPIKKITKATKVIASGNFGVKLDIKGSGELGTLADSFEEMVTVLQKLEQMRRDFVSNVSHEVQSPLTSISGYAMALRQENIPHDDRVRYLNIIIDEAERMSKMSDSLLKLSSLESQSHPLHMVTVGIDEQIRRVIVAIQPQWAQRNIQFDLHLEPITLVGDYDLLNQVWSNLINNSIKFSEDHSTITISMKQTRTQAIVTVSDTGIGISKEDQVHIFERFFKADRSHSRKYVGSGMGLAIVKQIVSLHHGDISVQSEVGKGTTFIVALPLHHIVE